MRPFISSRIAEIIFAVVIIIFGINHFMAGSAMAGGVPSFIPGGVIWVYITGTGFILAGLAIIIDRYKTLACYLLALMLIIFVLTIHVPGYINGEGMSRMMSRTNGLKDIAIAMGAILIGNRGSTNWSDRKL
jgi:putative oxidoreductase